MAKNISPGQLVMYATIVLTIISIIFATLFDRGDALILGVGVGLTAYGLKLSNGYILLLSSMAIFLSSYLPFGHSTQVLIQGFKEGFSNEAPAPAPADEEEGYSDADSASETEGFDDDAEEGFDEGDETEGYSDSGDEADTNENFTSAEFSSKNTFEGFANKPAKKKKAPPPDNGDRAEMFELGKKYKMPKESDDPEYHLDAGTTFMNAYKSLKPDQISAMTKDTQDLINTQKQLMATLNTLKPLITDGKQMMDTFQGYFGAGGANVGDLAQMAEKFAPK